MNNLNSILIEGRLTKEPRLSEVGEGKNVCRLSLASNRYYRNTEKELVNEVNYIDVDVWGNMAQVCSDNLSKGRGVRVVGRLKHERWQDEEQNYRDRHIIIAEHVEFFPDSAKKTAEEDQE